MIASSATRVPRHTAASVNDQIHRETQDRLRYFQRHPEHIERRLRELDHEWDVERALATGSSTLSLAGLVLGIGVDRRFLALPLAVQGFFLQHALQGWCPPLPVFRRLGFRTPDEINEERYALLALRGDPSPTMPHPEPHPFPQATA